MAQVRALLRLPVTSKLQLRPFNLQQTRALMKAVADSNYPDQYVQAVLEKTGGMPLYIEKARCALGWQGMGFAWLVELGRAGCVGAPFPEVLKKGPDEDMSGRTAGI
jgi:hypothetical protein